ncbi:hypothetical protein GCM10007989_04980 [Devosia pacifica]|uniref:Uncharacterized protein n=1 Tax=Devosia pacifica TaxID=1335967 RepID=A0A918VNX5_9HYPH|nr:hypothetical protein [Devosia pacifica]GHA13383.1 hypothetical protein GCM10007989_04980 [Devosia pacifica]
MSLARIALRIAAVEAIKGHTLVGQNVLDSPNGALDIQADGTLRTEKDKPFVSVFTDQGKAEGVTNRSLVENGLVDIVFEIGLSTAMLEHDPETKESRLVGITVPATDRTFEFFLDVVQRQIADALNDPANEWAEIYRGLHYHVVKVEYAGARNTDDGQRLAGHQMRVTIALADDPVKGEQMDEDAPFMRFLDRLDATEDVTYQTQAAMIRSLIEGQNTPWQDILKRHGLTADELLAVGLGPLAVKDDLSAPEFEVGSLEVEGADETDVTP